MLGFNVSRQVGTMMRILVQMEILILAVLLPQVHYKENAQDLIAIV